MNPFVSSPKTQHGRQTQESEREPADSGFELIWFLGLCLITATIGIVFVVQWQDSRQHLQREQWRDVNSASFFYQSWFGEMPPATDRASIKQHFERCYQRSSHDFDAFVANLPHRLEDLDEREAVLFWLAGTATRAAGFADPVIIKPDASRIIDADRDGWPELTDRRKNIFLLRDGKTFVLDPATNQVTPANSYRFRQQAEINQPVPVGCVSWTLPTESPRTLITWPGDP